MGGLVKMPCTARNDSVASADDAPMTSVILKATGCTEVMALLRQMEAEDAASPDDDYAGFDGDVELAASVGAAKAHDDPMPGVAPPVADKVPSRPTRIDLTALAQKQPQKREEAITGWLPMGASVLMHSHGGVGKAPSLMWSWPYASPLVFPSMGYPWPGSTE